MNSVPLENLARTQRALRGFVNAKGTQCPPLAPISYHFLPF